VPRRRGHGPDAIGTACRGLQRFGRADHDRQILGDERADAAGPPQRDEKYGEAEL
jgi:hypothetical protein